jgi:hypothetical protein
MTQGDLWIDTIRKQLYFYDGESTILAGPAYTKLKETGFFVEEISGTDSVTYKIIKLYIDEHLIAIISNDSFTPAEIIPEYSGDIMPGWNPSDIATEFKLYVPVHQADVLVTPDGLSTRNTDDFMSTSEDSTTSGQITILNDMPLMLGTSNSTEINASISQFEIKSNYANQETRITLKNNSGLVPGLYLKAGSSSSTHRAGLWTDSPTTNFDVAGNAKVTGTLTVSQLAFSGTGAITLNSNNDLTLQATGWINLNSLTVLPKFTKSALQSYLAPTASIAFCTNGTGGASPVWFDGTNWISFKTNAAI